MQPARNIVQLRQLLAERLPHLRQLPLPGVRKELAARTPPGAPGLGHWVAQGFPRSAITEVVGKPGGGGALFIQGLLRRAAVFTTGATHATHAAGFGDIRVNRARIV